MFAGTNNSFILPEAGHLAELVSFMTYDVRVTGKGFTKRT
jgi:hypothetical protein